MENPDAALLFPSRVIAALGGLRGEAWQALVEHVLQQPAGSLPCIGFVLMMVRLSVCTTCHTDSFRALKGCTHCAIQAVRRYHGSDQELINLFDLACAEVETFLSSKH